MTDLEISKALALAIGWTNIKCFDGVFALAEGDYWRTFDYRDWSVIGPIAERYDCFPRKRNADWWMVFKEGKFIDASTPQKAIAFAVINWSKK